MPSTSPHHALRRGSFRVTGRDRNFHSDSALLGRLLRSGLSVSEPNRAGVNSSSGSMDDSIGYCLEVAQAKIGKLKSNRRDRQALDELSINKRWSSPDAPLFMIGGVAWSLSIAGPSAGRILDHNIKCIIVKGHRSTALEHT